MKGVDYSKWDSLTTSDGEEEVGAKREQTKGQELRLPDGAGKPDPSFVDTFLRASQASRKTGPISQPSFPETLEEHALKCNEAQELKIRGNKFYEKGDILEAAKLYEQAVFKFAHWYADMFASDEERTLVNAVKLPCHLNLAACSARLGNHDHTVTHCSQVLKQEPRNIKALFRRGAAHNVLGNLDEALSDLRLAAEIAPEDCHIRRELSKTLRLQAEYRSERRNMSKRMVS